MSVRAEGASPESARVGTGSESPASSARRKTAPLSPPLGARSHRAARRSQRINVLVLVVCLSTLGTLAFVTILRRDLEIMTALPFIGFCLLTTLYLFQMSSGATTLLQLRDDVERAEATNKLNLSVITSLATAIDAKDQHVYGHLERVRDLSVLLAEEVGLGEGEMEALKIAAILHDIGKMAVPDYILSKPGKLTKEEMSKVRTHAAIGATILEPAGFPRPVVPFVRFHHEWYDGGGYPEGLREEGIPLGARILAVADVYDTLLSTRPYRPALTAKKAVSTMEELSGRQFDPRVVQALLRVIATHRTRGSLEFLFDDSTGPPRPPAEPVLQQAAFEDIAQANQELLALYEIVQTMGSSLNIQETLNLVISKTQKIVNFTTCVITLVDRGRTELTVAAAAGILAERLQNARLPLGEGLSGEAALIRSPSAINAEASRDMGFFLGPVGAATCPLQHALVVPLVPELGEGDILGTISLYHDAEHTFTADDLRPLTIIARQAAIAISNAHRFEQTEKLAVTDPLTGLPNGRYFSMHLEQELSRARREKEPVSLLALDLDDFKSINDTYGHQQGDHVLRELADVFRSQVRDYDTVARYAGDEFFIILPQTTYRQAQETAERIKAAVSNYVPKALHAAVRISVSIGVVTFPGDAAEVDTLIAAADRAMYTDKRLSEQRARLIKENAAGVSEPEKAGRAAQP